MRDGRAVEVPTGALVPGDLLLFREGDVLHADGMVRSAANLAVDESQLTGEAEPQDKIPASAVGAEAANACHFFAGSVVPSGFGAGEIIETGARTRFGNIARLVSEAELAATPLQVKTARVARWLVGITLALAAAIFAARWLGGAPLGDAVLYVVVEACGRIVAHPTGRRRRLADSERARGCARLARGGYPRDAEECSAANIKKSKNRPGALANPSRREEPNGAMCLRSRHRTVARSMFMSLRVLRRRSGGARALRRGAHDQLENLDYRRTQDDQHHRRQDQ